MPALRKTPSRNALYALQVRIETAFGDVDEYHFYATGRSSRFGGDRSKTDHRNVLKKIDAEIKALEDGTAKYIHELKYLRNMIKTKMETK